MSRSLLAGIIVGFGIAVALLSSHTRPPYSQPDAGLVIQPARSEKLTAMQQYTPLNLQAWPDGGTP